MKVCPARVLAARAMRSGFVLSAGELAAVAGLPSDVAVPGLDRARAKTAPAPIAVPGGGRRTKVLGRALAGGHSVALPVADARQHLHVLGSTGAGKSTFLTHLALADVKAGRGMVLIDPKGDLALDVLERLPGNAVDRLVLIDPDQPDGSAWFNPLQLRPGMDADLITDNLVSIFAAIFQRHWGPRIDDVLRVACLTLMRHPGPTLLNVPPLLNDKQFRSAMTAGFDDPAGLRGFWEWYETTPANLRAQVIGPVLARLRAFLLRAFVRGTIGDADSSFDMRRVLDGGGILIARLPKGQLGEDTSRLLGSMIFASVWQAAALRARIPEPGRRDAAVYIDEAHNVLNLSGTVSDMLAEARGYHLSLVLAHQHRYMITRPADGDLDILRAGCAAHLQHFQRGTFLTKSPFNSLRIPVLEETWPGRVRYIHIIRERTRAAESMRRNRFQFSFTTGDDSAEHAWDQFVDAIRRTAPQERLRTITHEDLSREPASTLSALLAWLGQE